MSDEDKVLTRHDLLRAINEIDARSDIDPHDTTAVLAYTVCGTVGCLARGAACKYCGTDWDDRARITMQSIQDHIDAKGFTVDFE